MGSSHSHANQVVEVDGIVYHGLEEFTLGGAGCEGVWSGLRIWLSYADEEVVRQDKTLGRLGLRFKRDSRSKKLDRLLRSRTCAGPRVRVRLRGYLQYRQETVEPGPNAEVKTTGFGHMGMYTYRLVIESVESVQPLPCKEPVVGLNF